MKAPTTKISSATINGSFVKTRNETKNRWGYLSVCLMVVLKSNLKNKELSIENEEKNEDSN